MKRPITKDIFVQAFTENLIEFYRKHKGHLFDDTCNTSLDYIKRVFGNLNKHIEDNTIYIGDQSGPFHKTLTELEISQEEAREIWKAA